MRGNRYLVLAVAVATALAAVNCGGAANQGGINGAGSAPRVVRIGAINALTGPGASSGLDTIRGAELAVKIINGRYPGIGLPLAETSGLPRLGGARIQLIERDTKGSPEAGAANVSTLGASDHVSGIVGEYTSSVTKAASARAEQLGVPFVNGASSAPELTERGLTWFFRVGPTDETFGADMFGVLKQIQAQGGQTKRVAILHTNDTYGNGADQVTRSLALRDGYRVVADVAYNAGATDLTPQLLQIRAANPDVLFDASYTPDAIRIVKGLQRLRYYPKGILAYGAGFSDSAFLPAVGSAADGMMSRSAWSVQTPNPASKKIATLFQQTYHHPMTESSARNFEAMMTLAEAINNAGSTGPGKVRRVLASIDIPRGDLITPWRGVRFGPGHQNIEADGIIQQVQHSRYEVVYPKAYAVAKVIWPLAKAQG